jgi:acetate---CoA ligase (ADP-forming)
VSDQDTELDAFFHPASVAVLGSVPANSDLRKFVQQYVERFSTDRVYLVNPSARARDAVEIYRSVADLPEIPSLALFNIPAAAVPDALEECGRAGVRYALVFSAGFSEVGPDGAALEQRLADVATRFSIRVLGPNTNTNAFETMPPTVNTRGGKIALVTQSGHQGRPIVQGSMFGVAFSRWVPTGNEVDLEVADFIAYFAEDPETAVIAGYFEGFRDSEKLRAALHLANRFGKPIVALKVGKTEAGRRMAMSHTGHLTGSDAVVDGLFEQYGVTRVADLDELLETAALFSKLPSSCGTRACLYSISGGSSALMAETAETHGVSIPTLTEDTQRRLHEILPYYLTVSNPVDNGGQFLLHAPRDKRLQVLEAMTDDPNCDLVVVGITGALGPMTDNLCSDICDFANVSNKPIIVTWNSFKTDEQGFNDLVASGLPIFRSFRNCFLALAAWSTYQRKTHWIGNARARAGMTHREWPLDPAMEGGVLGHFETRRLLAAFDIPLVDEWLIEQADEVLPQQLPEHLVLKISSPDFPHKSDLGLVRVNVSSSDARTVSCELLERARSENPVARIEGVVIQPFISEGVEMLAGIFHDPVLGPAVSVGVGGMFAELYRDVAVRPVPLGPIDAEEMLNSLRGRELLEGYRGGARADREALIGVILALGDLSEAADGRILELDLNPVIATPSGVVAVDALVVTSRATR